MDLVRVGAVILRSSQPLLPSLGRTSNRIGGGITRHHQPHRITTSSRSLSTTRTRHHPPPASPQSDGKAGKPTSAYDEAASMMGVGLGQANAAPKSFPPRSKTPFAQKREVYLAQQKPTQPDPDKNSYSDMLDSMLPASPAHAPLDFSFITGNNKTNPFQLSSLTAPPPAPPEPAPMKLNSTTGRRIPVVTDRGIDPARAFRMLDQRCNQNNVKRDFMAQRFHERGGLKRKRLRRERWRKRFKEGFKATVTRVQMMRKQGW